MEMVPDFRRDDVWIPGRVSLARNDDATLENVKFCESLGTAGGLLRHNDVAIKCVPT